MTKPARLILALLWVALIARAAPPNPGFYTFDGTQLRPLGLQRRAGSESFASNWRQLLQFGRTPSSFLAALKERSDTHEEEDDEEEEVEDEEDVVEDREDDDDGPVVPQPPSHISSAHLLPDYLTHQEFLKPQLQAAGFSGGRIIAGPFPVPLAGLHPHGQVPKPALRSGSVAPSTAPIAPPHPPPPPPVPSTKPKLQLFKLQQQQQQYKPVQFAAVPASPPPPPPSKSVTPHQRPTPAPAKLSYPLPSGGPVHWYAAHQSGPEKQASVLGQPTYSLPAVTDASSSSPTRLSYGGWTPIYSASYSNVALQDEDVATVAVAAPVAPPPELAFEPPASAISQPEEVQQELRELVAEADSTAPVVVVAAALTNEDDSTGTSTFIPPPPPADPATTSSSRRQSKTVRKRKAKQVLRNPSSLSPLTDAEVVIVTAAEASSLLPAGGEAGGPSSGRVQGRYVGRVMPASIYDDDDVIIRISPEVSNNAEPVEWTHLD